MVHKVVIIGSTGSIGEQALEVIAHHSDRFQVVGLAAGSNWRRLAEQALRLKVKEVAIGDENLYAVVKEALPGCRVWAGKEGLCRLAGLEEAQTVIVSVTGAVGILPTLAAVEAGKKVALANKETLVAAGDIVMKKACQFEATIIPVDSEHSAIFQCLGSERRYLRRLWLTASGGAFRDLPWEELQNVTPEMALRHPNWSMGKKITVDSATLMNKGLEVIEAHHLFSVDYDDIRVLIHRESIVHSMVEFTDGSFLAHLGVPDMRIPIQYALSYPERWPSLAQPLDWACCRTLQFEPPDPDRFPALDLAYQAGRTGGTMPAVLNAANEEAVHAFLGEKIRFVEIPELVSETMARHAVVKEPDLEAILDADRWARECLKGLIDG